MQTELTAEKKRKETWQLQIKYSFHKTSAHCTEPGSNSQCPPLLLTHLQKALLKEAPWGKKTALPPRRLALRSPQRCRVWLSVV